MKLASVEIENFRAIEKLTLALDPRLTVLHGPNAHGKTSVLGAIAAGLGAMTVLFPGATERGLLDTDLRVGGIGRCVRLPHHGRRHFLVCNDHQRTTGTGIHQRPEGQGGRNPK